MNNICRPFVLHNDFLPPIPRVHENWDFLSFGYNDGLSVGGNLFIGSCDSCNFQLMWEYQVKHEKKVGNGCSSHILWGVRCEDEQNVGVRDADFWKEKSDYPFLFVSLFQLTGECQNADRIKLERKLAEKGLYAITYLTFDNSDFILVLKCLNYADGADIISEFHNKDSNLLTDCKIGSLTYSFTIASINRTILSNDERIDKVEGIIQRAYIYAIEGNLGGVAKLYEGIKEILGESCVDPKENVLGCNDEVIVVNTVPWSKFLKFFKEYMNMPVEWSESLIGITTIIGHPSKVEGAQLDKGKGKQAGGEASPEISGTERTFLSDSMWEKCSNIKSDLQGDNIRLEDIKTNIYQMINSLRKFEKTPIKDYLFQMALLPLNMVLDIGQSINAFYQEDFINSFYDFMKGLNLYAQNSDRSDRQFVQSLDLKIRIYDAPVKLNAFYNSFVFFTVKFLNDLDNLLAHKKQVCMDMRSEQHEYEFLGCPGVTDNMRVQEMFKSLSDIKRVFLIEMPERQVYNPKMMLIMLAHEVGHFVGKNVRGREARLNYAIDILARMTVRYMQIELKKCYLSETFLDNIEDYWNKVEKVIAEKLRSFNKDYEKYLTSRKFRSGSLKDKQHLEEIIKKRRYHSEILKQLLMEAINYILLEEENGLWNYIIQKAFIYWVDLGDMQAEQKKFDFRKKILQIVRDFLAYEVWGGYNMSAFCVIDLLTYLFKECIADMVAILTLGISLKDYLEATLQSAEAQGCSQKDGIMIIDIRRCMIVFCMIREHVWGDTETKEVSESSDEKVRSLWVRTYNLLLDHFYDTGETYDNKETDIFNAVNLILDHDVIYKLMEYLLESKKKFDSYKAEENLCEQRGLLEEKFKLFENGNIVAIVEKMQEYIEQYLREMEKRKNEEKEKWKQKEGQQNV